MPELPEVETIKEQLKKNIIGHKITNVFIYWPNIILSSSIEDFIKKITSQMINDVKRRGKWLIIELEKDCLLIHLRMEGKFFLKTQKDCYNKHEHVIFILNDKTELRYHDTRKFGRMQLITKTKLNNSLPLNKLGLEPFDKKLTVCYLKTKFKRRSIPIKSVLLDQSIIAGIGNIYANEILFLAGINPLKPAFKLKNLELELIIKYTKQVLKEAIKKGGTTIRSYLSLDNKKGEFQEQLLVHGKQDRPCINCKTMIKKVAIRGRGTYYCPKCQS